jgi:hypothetical protein
MLADLLFRQIPAGLGSEGAITLDPIEISGLLCAQENSHLQLSARRGHA